MKIALLPCLFVAACAVDAVEAVDDEADTTQSISSQNGLPAINGVNTQNGLNIQNGLNTQNGLKDGVGLMSSVDGRATLSYLVRCALPATSVITKKDQYGTSYSFKGALGFAPQWETGYCDTMCQQWISACMVAHINTAGVHVPLWIVAQPTGIGWELNASYPNQEGSFFGNIFTSPPTLYYCNGRNYNVNVVPGRIGQNTTNLPYVDPWGFNAYCDSYCTPSDYPYASSGYKACAGSNAVVTVWRQ